MMNTTIKEAIELRNTGKAEEARLILLELLEMNSENPDILYQLAWTHDVLGLEREAVPYYERALEQGLQEEHRPGAMLGLGSTYRTLGEYTKAKDMFEKALKEYPNHKEFQVFYAMVLYNLGECGEAMRLILHELIETTTDTGIKRYAKAIEYYSDKLDQTWD